MDRRVARSADETPPVNARRETRRILIDGGATEQELEWQVASCPSPEEARRHVEGMSRLRKERPPIGTENVAPPANTRGLRTVRLADVKTSRVEWLWSGRIPRGMLTVLDGDPGLGKSTVMLDIAARVSTGRTMPFDTQPACRPADVVLMNVEDSVAAVVKPRLIAAGADLERVHSVEAMPSAADPNAPPTLSPACMAALEDEIMKRAATLVVIDPLMAFLGTDVDAHRDQDVRRVLRALAAVAEKTAAAVVLVRHPKKGAGSALHRGGGSIGIIGAARSALYFAEDPTDSALRILAVSKSNIGRRALAVRLRLVEAERRADQETDEVARVEWLGTDNAVTADRLADLSSTTDATQLARAIEALRDLLCRGPIPAKEAESEVRSHVGCSRMTVRRAKEQLGVHSEPERDDRGRIVESLWRLPNDPHAQTKRGEHVDTCETVNPLISLNFDDAEPLAHPPDAQHGMSARSADGAVR